MSNRHHHSYSFSFSSDSLSTSDLEAGVGVGFPFHPSSPSPSIITRSRIAPRPSSMASSAPQSPRFCFFFPDVAGSRHFLDSCHLCHVPIGSGRDIYMYRGDTPFCSEECRNEQIEMDEAEEKRAKMAKKQQKAKRSTSPSKSENMRQLRAAGTVVAG